ncbi:MAG TPA: V-type ATP synthase subunit I [Dictyoglomaceae bacterium]|nr:V-type ATP synthase subunit I [Dictyoglomaceae bacterium]HOL39147.1 V-type ATP synthase subunit I [Dictyoglomaceae bacterium]HPP15301.1 V-type ATP synthase subunit I [Dictyoglomaceae bacterium]HPU42707.1 V-type ATP synthase subunit I [Dictyoglomaceae bacterium]
MAILKLERFWVVLPKDEEGKILEIFKGFPNIHWEKLSSEVSTSGGGTYGEAIGKIEEILKILMRLFPEKKGLLEAFFAGREEIDDVEFERLRSEIHLESIYEELKSIEKTLNILEEKEKFLLSLYDETAYWSELEDSLDFPRTFKRFILYSGSFKPENWKKFLEDAKDILEVSWYKVINTSRETKVIFLIPKENKPTFEELLQKYNFDYRRIPYLKGTPSENLKRISSSLEKSKQDLAKLLDRAKSIAEKKRNILAWYDYFISKSSEQKINEYPYKSRFFDIFSGWIPKRDKNKFLDALKARISDCGFETRDPLPEEDPPVILENPKIIRPFEFLTKLYGLPPYGFIDPTPFMAPFYMLFFGICLGDVGYGTLLLLSTIWIKKKFGPEEDTKDLIDLLSVLSIPSIFIGILTWSFFGNQIFLGPDGKFLGILPLINPSQDLIAALGISLFIGIIAQFYALILRFISCLKVGDWQGALYDAGLWILFLGSLLLYFGSQALNIILPLPIDIFKYLIFVGLVGLVLTQGRDHKGIARFVVGLISLYGILGGYGLTSFMGDILSYSRLFALNLVGSIFGFVITDLANMLRGIPIVGWVLLVLIWVGGQLLNFVLSALSAFIHSTRLQFLELYGRFFVDGGRKFLPFKAEGKFFKVKKNYDGRY